MIDVHETELVVLHKAVILFPQFFYNPLVGSTVQFEMSPFVGAFRDIHPDETGRC